MIFRIIAAIMAGYISHQLRPFLEGFGYGWRDLLKYAAGVLGVMPFNYVIHEAMSKHVTDKKMCVFYSYALANASFGLGVTLGWLADALEESHPAIDRDRRIGDRRVSNDESTP